MSEIANNLATFEGDITTYANDYNKLDQSQNNLNQHIGELNTMWEGEAHDTMIETFNKDYKDVLNIISFLKEINNDLTFAKTEYTNCEGNVSNIIAGMEV